MFKKFYTQISNVSKTQFQLQPDMLVCQIDYPLDWYQKEFIPYAEEYLHLPDRSAQTVIPWMRRYIEPALDYFGEDLMLLAHYYMGGDIVNVIEQFGGSIGDSYQLALMVVNHPEKKLIVESAVHFMAETISILANKDQSIYITNPKAGCTMEMYAKDFMVIPAIEELNERYGREKILPVCYMNTSGRIKALAGAQDGAVCTSSNVKKIFEWALTKNKKILFIPDKNMGENVAHWLAIPQNNIAYWPAGIEGAHYSLFQQNQRTLDQFDRAQLILFSSLCSVHDYYRAEMVEYWQRLGFNVVVHPECRLEVVEKADACGSTAFIADYVLNDKTGTKKYAIGTENHMVQNVKQQCVPRGIEVVNVGDAPLSQFKGMGCGCATMSRNDPPHLVGTLDLLRKGKKLDYNLVWPGDVVDEFTGKRERLDRVGQKWIVDNARIALENMIRITEG
ncbi:MAG: quinolinate synthase NadA [Gammaproteobacteria bacterium]|nr:quinolinate synthase NadA [Gammaproteobacteria bacterium]